MTVQSKTTLKGYFNTGDVPSEANFADLIDTLVSHDSVGTHITVNEPILMLGGGMTDTTIVDTVFGLDLVSGLIQQDVGVNYGNVYLALGSNIYSIWQIFAKSRSLTGGSNVIVQNGDELGRLYFLGDDGANLQSSAYISAAVDGVPGANDMPGRIEFWTTPDGSLTPAERVRINNQGNILIGTSTDGMTAAGSLAIAKDLAHRGTKTGFYNTAPITKPTGVAVTAAGIHAALVSLGLIAA